MNDFVLASELQIGAIVDITVGTTYFENFEIEAINPLFVKGFVKKAGCKIGYIIPFNKISYIESYRTKDGSY